MTKKRIINQRLQVLLKEVLRNTPDDLANNLVESYAAGDVITVSIASSMYGDPITHQCAFGWSTRPDYRLSDTVGNA